jgi:hypothetical protein
MNSFYPKKKMHRVNSTLGTDSPNVTVCSEYEEGRTTNIINGVVTGTVISNNDPEHLNRVKIRFPWLLSTNNETDWVRVRRFMTPIKRENANSTVLEVGDEVLVVFDQGDISRPYVVGALWDNIIKPVKTSYGTGGYHYMEDKKNRTMLKNSKLDGGGHQFHCCEGSNRHKRQFLDENSSGLENVVTIQDTMLNYRQKEEEKKKNIIEINLDLNSVSISTHNNLHIKASNIEIEAGVG